MKALNYVLVLLLICLYLPMQSQVQSSEYVYFDHDKYELNDDAKIKLDVLAQQVLAASDYQLKIIGHTDPVGSIDYNEALAAKRAFSVSDYLAQFSIPKNKIHVASKGELDLLAKEISEESNAINRRVELITTKYNFETVTELLQQLPKKSIEQSFLIQPSQSSTISGNKGSKIEIPANAFVYKDGTVVTGEVEVKIIEAFDFVDFAANDLSCISEETVLESGGMMKISATSKGQEVYLNSEKSIDVTYPESKIKDDMKLFYGDRIEQGVDNWIVTKSDITADFSENQEPINVDLDQFLTPMINKPEYSKMVIERIQNKPTKPRKPFMARTPVEPKREHINLGLSKWQKLTTKQSKVEALIDDKYKLKMEEYMLKCEQFEEYQLKYQTALEDYKDACDQYKVDLEDWYELARVKIAEVVKKHHDTDAYDVIKNTWFAQNYLLKNKDGDLPSDQVFLQFYSILNSKIYPNDIRNDYIRAFGRSYETIFREIENRRKYVDIKERDDQYVDVKIIASNANKMAFQLEVANSKDLKTNTLGRYVMNVSRLGWINCDRFIDVPLEMRRRIAIVDKEETNYFLVFKNMKSMISARNEGDLYKFSNLPHEVDVMLVGVQVQEGKPFLFVKSLKTTENVKLAPSFQRTSVAEISNLFDELHNQGSVAI